MPYQYPGARSASRNGRGGGSEGCCSAFCIQCCGVKRGVAEGGHHRRPGGSCDRGVRGNGGYCDDGRGRDGGNYCGGGCGNHDDDFVAGGDGRDGVRGRIHATYAEQAGYRNTSTHIMGITPDERPGRSPQRRASPNRRRPYPQENRHNDRRQLRRGRSSSRDSTSGSRKARRNASRRNASRRNTSRRNASRRSEGACCDPSYSPEIPRPYRARQRTPPGNVVERIPRAPYDPLNHDKLQVSNSNRYRGRHRRTSRRRLPPPPPPPTSDSHSEISYPGATYDPGRSRPGYFTRRGDPEQDDRGREEDTNESTESDSEYRSFPPPEYATVLDSTSSYSGPTHPRTPISPVTFVHDRSGAPFIEETSATPTEIITSWRSGSDCHLDSVDSASTPNNRGVSTAGGESNTSRDEGDMQVSPVETSSQISWKLVDSGTELGHPVSLASSPSWSQRSSLGPDTTTHVDSEDPLRVQGQSSGSSMSVPRPSSFGTSDFDTISTHTSSSRPGRSGRYPSSSSWTEAPGSCMTTDSGGPSAPPESIDSHRTWSQYASSLSVSKVSRSPSGSTSSITTMIRAPRQTTGSHSACSPPGPHVSRICTEVSSSADETSPLSSPSTRGQSSFSSACYPSTSDSARCRLSTDGFSPSCMSSVYSPTSQSGRPGAFVVSIPSRSPPQMEYIITPPTPFSTLSGSDSRETMPRSSMLSSPYPSLVSNSDEKTHGPLTPQGSASTTSTWSPSNFMTPSSSIYYDTTPRTGSQSNTPPYAVSLISTFIPAEDLPSGSRPASREPSIASASVNPNPHRLALVPWGVATTAYVSGTGLQVDGTAEEDLLSVVEDDGMPMSAVPPAATPRYWATVESVIDSDDTGGVGVA